MSNHRISRDFLTSDILITTVYPRILLMLRAMKAINTVYAFKNCQKICLLCEIDSFTDWPSLQTSTLPLNPANRPLMGTSFLVPEVVPLPHIAEIFHISAMVKSAACKRNLFRPPPPADCIGPLSSREILGRKFV
jgi:hypothetical protein